MSAKSEQLVEQLNELEQKINEETTNGNDVTSLIERRAVLSEQLRNVLGALNESKVLKG